MVLDIFENVDEDVIKFLKDFLASDKNISLKTELNNVEAITLLEVLADYYSDIEVVKNILQKFILYYKINMVSYKRQSRKEFVEILKSQKDEVEKSKLDKILGV